MNYTILGRTGLRVSVAGLGCGGHSRLGQSYGASHSQSIAVVQAALDEGIDFFDTAAAYRTESILGAALVGRRDKLIISTKTMIYPFEDKAARKPYNANEIGHRIEESLKRLQTDYIDIFNLHGVRRDELDYAEKELVPALLAARGAGKIRFIGITKQFGTDTTHEMLNAALDRHDVWDVVMVGFNLLNQSARQRVLKLTREKSIGVLDMFAVRRALSDIWVLRERLAAAVTSGEVEPSVLDVSDPLDFVLAGDVISRIDAAYRFCRHEPGINVVLTGTGNIEHLRENVASINRGPLPETVLYRLKDLFGKVTSLSGN